MNLRIVPIGILGIILLAQSRTAKAAGGPWHYQDLDRRISAEVSAQGVARMNKVVEAHVDFSTTNAVFNSRSLRVVEVDGQGVMVDDAVAFQFDKAADFDPVNKAHGTLCLMLHGRTLPEAVRHFQVYYSLAETASVGPRMPELIHVSDKFVILKDMECFKIETPIATYIYGKDGAGFASIIDRDGNDWISYSHSKNAAGEYHGLPKFGHPEKLFHAGYKGFHSELRASGPLKVEIYSEATDNKSACIWDFYPNCATVTLLKFKLPSYWFLYEGTPGGKLDVEKDFVVRSNGKKTPLSEPWSDNIPWVYFGVPQTNYALFMAAHQRHDKVDSYVAWPFKKEDDGSFQQMTVFGFGRKGYKELVQHIADLTALPARYTIGFVDGTEFEKARGTIESAYRDVKVVVGEVEVRK